MPDEQQAATTPDLAVPSASTASSTTDIIEFEKWLNMLGERKGSDIHLTVGNVPMIRVQGNITPMVDEDILTPERIERILDYILTEEESKRFAADREIIMGKTLKKVMRFRVHAFYSRGYVALSFRRLPSEEYSLEALGLPDVVRVFLTAAQGLILVTGPFDSGKTTTARSMISKINHEQARYIATLEAPIEYIIPSDKSVVVQREVLRDVKDFPTGLDALTEEDVDIVLVSEFDSSELVLRAITLAQSGRLVIAIARSRHSVALLQEIRDLFPEEEHARILTMLSESLIGIVAQLLLPKVGGGRTLLTEILNVTHPTASLIRDNKIGQIPNIMQTSRQDGMITMDKALAEAVRAGSVTIEDAKKHAIDQSQFNMLVSH